MNWKKEASDKLRTLEARRASISHSAEEIARIEDEMLSVKSALRSSTPVQGGSSSYEERLLTLIVQKDELSFAVKMSKKWVALIDKVLAELSPSDRRILDLCYIHSAKGNIERLADEFEISQPMVYRRRDAALLTFTRRLYGWVET